jgi:hypothetical protein
MSETPKKIIKQEDLQNLGSMGDIFRFLFVEERDLPISNEPLVLNRLKFSSLNPVDLPPRYLEKSALNDNDTRYLIDGMMKIDQLRDPTLPQAQFIKSVLITEEETNAEETDSAKTVLATTITDKVQNDIRDNHYVMVHYLLQFHVYLSRLFDVNHDINLLIIKRQIEKSLIQYEAHDAAFCIQIEENQLKVYRSLFTVISSVKIALVEYGKATIKKQKAAQRTGRTIPSGGSPQITKPSAAAPSPVIRTPRPESQEVVTDITRSINMYYNSSVSDSNRIDPEDLEKANAKNSEGSISVMALTPQFIASLPNIDLLDVKNTNMRLYEFERAFSLIVSNGLKLVQQAREKGIISPSPANVVALEDIRSKIYPYIPLNLDNSNFAAPTLYIIDEITLSVMLGKPRRGRVLYTANLQPGERQELRIKTTTRSVEERAKSDTIFNADSQTTRDEFEKSLEKETNTAESTEKEGTKAVHVDGSASYGVGGFGAKVNASYDSTERVKKNRSEATNNLESASQNHTQENNARREATVTETSKSTMEKTQEEGTIKILENHNKAKGIDVLFHEMYQVNKIYQSLTGMKMGFYNGSKMEVFNPSDIDEVLDKILTEDSDELRENIKNQVRYASKVTDIDGRRFNLLTEENGFMDVVFKKYSQFLEGYAEAQPEDIKSDYRYLKGILLSESENSFKSGGIAASTSLSAGNAMDKFNQIHAIAGFMKDIALISHQGEITSTLAQYKEDLKAMAGAKALGQLDQLELMVKGYSNLFKYLSAFTLQKIDFDLKTDSTGKDTPLNMNLATFK